jgi:hypothetical protein
MIVDIHMLAAPTRCIAHLICTSHRILFLTHLPCSRSAHFLHCSAAVYCVLSALWCVMAVVPRVRCAGVGARAALHSGASRFDAGRRRCTDASARLADGCSTVHSLRTCVHQRHVRRREIGSASRSDAGGDRSRGTVVRVRRTRNGCSCTGTCCTLGCSIRVCVHKSGTPLSEEARSSSARGADRIYAPSSRPHPTMPYRASRSYRAIRIVRMNIQAHLCLLCAQGRR